MTNQKNGFKDENFILFAYVEAGNMERILKWDSFHFPNVAQFWDILFSADAHIKML